jgi:hypothetical protein
MQTENGSTFVAPEIMVRQWLGADVELRAP